MTTDPTRELCDWLIAHKAVDYDFTEEDLAELKRLDLSGLGIERLPEGFGALKNLISLNLSNNLLTALPASFEALDALLNLDLRRNAFERLDDMLAALPLKSLNASGNRLSDIDGLRGNTTLRVLDLSGNALTDVDAVLTGLDELRSLNLSYNYLDDLEELFAGLGSIEVLNVNHNLLASLGPAVGAMQMLRRFEAADNRIAHIDDAFFGLELEYLDLSSNELHGLTLRGLSDLEELILDDNDLSSSVMADDFAPSLRTFSAEGCCLSEALLPPSPCLEVLGLASNALSSLSESLSRYVTLYELDVDNNQLKELPECLEYLESLSTLYIDSNPLSERSRERILKLDFETCDLSIKPDILIRKAQYDDLRVMARLIAQLFAIESDFVADFDKQYQGLKMLFDEPGVDLIVAKHRNSVVGMVSMQPLISSAEGAPVGLIEDLIVDEAFRKMGIGSRLIAKAKSLAAERGYRRLQLAADKENARALYFYRKRGFRKTNLNLYHFTGFEHA